MTALFARPPPTPAGPVPGQAHGADANASSPPIRVTILAWGGGVSPPLPKRRRPHAGGAAGSPCVGAKEPRLRIWGGRPKGRSGSTTCHRSYHRAALCRTGASKRRTCRP